jgi:sugar lactone lactonase YvrE
MFEVRSNRLRKNKIAQGLVILLAIVAAFSNSAEARGKKKAAPAEVATERVLTPADFDFSKLVWPEPPDIARVRYTTFFIGEKIQDIKKVKPKTTWMDRLAGSEPVAQNKNVKIPFQLIAPYGLAVDSEGFVYAADQRVGGIFIINFKTGETHMIKNGREAHFKLLNGLAIDDDDRLFVSDGDLGHVLVFNKQHQQVQIIRDGMSHPVGLAIDTENRLLYVVDSDLDQVLVYDADGFKLLRKIGTTGHNHELTTPGDFANPTNVAVDKDGNVYVSDTLNDRVEIFDADGQFISTFGKNCDGPGCFQRPKGIAIDSDGHVWVADAVQARVQIFDKNGRLLAYLGQYGKFPGQFSSLAGITIDKQNRVFISDQQPGRIQEMQYVTDAEATAEKARRAQQHGSANGAGQTAAAKSGPKPKNDSSAGATVKSSQ